MKSNYAPSWKFISYVGFDCSGWGMVPSTDTKLYFTDIAFEKYKYAVDVSGSKTEQQYLDQVIESWRSSVVGDGGSSTYYNTSIASMETRALKSWKTNSNSYVNTFVGTGTSAKGTLFKANPSANWAGATTVQTIYSHINYMARAYAAKGSSYYKDPALLTAIKNSLEYAYNNYYGVQHLTDPAYKQWVKDSNWWNWEIGIPKHLVEILILLADDLTQDEINKYLIPVDYFVPYVSYSACNRLWVGRIRFASKILQNETVDALLTLEELYQVFDYVATDDGFYTDGSFIQHNNHAYTGAYGASILYELSQLLYAIDGTAFKMPQEKLAVHYNWVFDSFEPLMYKSNLMAMVKGRDVVRANNYEKTTLNGVFGTMVVISSYAPDEVNERLLPLIKYFIENNEISSLISNVPIGLIDYVYAIRDDDSIVARSGYEIFKVFGNMDRIVQHRPSYSVGIALSSTRIYKYEAINDENKNGWYNGDGTVYIYTEGYDFSNLYFNYSDSLKRPGTTVTATSRLEENLVGGIFGSSDFASGVEHGKYGVSAMILGYAQNDYFNTDITGKKSYFMFDDEIVMLGSGISESTTGDQVYTTVENRFWNTNDVFTVDGVQKSTSGSANAKYMHFTNMGGYVFDGETGVSYKKYTNTYSFLEITISHGAAPSDAEYFFVYLPGATAAETKAYSDALAERITVISQTNTVHAVKDNDIGVTGYVFYEAGICNGITVSAPCILMVSESGGVTSVSVSDPTHKLDSLTVTVNGTQLDFDVEGNAGNTFTKTIE